ncbi:integral membrane protein 2B-like [Diretmus argenteus]
MVKVAFMSSWGQKEPSKPGSDEALLPADTDVEDVQVQRQRSRLWRWIVCVGLGLMLTGMVVGGACLYKAHVMTQSDAWPLTLALAEEEVYPTSPPEDWMEFCQVIYWDQDDYTDEYTAEDLEAMDLEEMGVEVVEVDGVSMVTRVHHLQENVRVVEEETLEVIDVSGSPSAGSDPASIVHDFNQRLTVYLDLTVKKCYIAPLNVSAVMQPRDFHELLLKAQSHLPGPNRPTAHLPRSQLVREQMMVTERLDDLEEFGEFIANMCGEHETYRLELRADVYGLRKREAPNCRRIRHFEHTFVVETQICGP